ncbi:hypothetical protein [Burkholderia gladioli]|uniref:hypothetical protein n=1 Tax=Burkholderia gladioli TaxID=28095 RepID=UPI002FDF39EF
MELTFADFLLFAGLTVPVTIVCLATWGAKSLRDAVRLLTARRLAYAAAGAATAAWTAWYWSRRFPDPYVAGQHALLLFGSICCIAYVETACHELGHLATGLIYRMPLAQVRLCSSHKEMELIAPRWTFAVGLLPGSGRVDFYAYPLERSKRIVMYAGGIASSMVTALLVCAFLPAALNWARVEILLYATFAAVFNGAVTLSGERWSDGQAIRALRAYDRGHR